MTDAALITSEEELLALDGWSALAQRAAMPFQSPEWLLPWWRGFGTGRMLVAIVRSGGRLAGMLACYVLDEPPHRKLLPMGAGTTDYVDALLDPDAPPGVAVLLLDRILGGAAGVTSCDLLDLPPDAVLRHASAPPGWCDEITLTTPCPVLAAPDGTTDFRHAIPARMHRKLRMNRHRAERHGGWTHAVAAEADLAEAMEALVGLHASRWDGRGEPGGVFADARVLDFVRQIAPGLMRTGALALHTLRFGTEIVAACMALAAGDRLMLYLSGFDGAHAFRSPGTILLGEIVEQALRDRRDVHFLRGGESYKYAWGAVDRFNAVRRLTPR